MEMLFPTVEHRFCVKHIYSNFKLNFKGLKLKAALWRCAAATTVRDFEKRMQDMKDLDKEAWEYLANIEPTQWTKSHFTQRAISDCYVNNLSELLNSIILDARDKPIIAMLERIRIYSKRTKIEKFTSDICPNIIQKLEQLKVDSKSFFAIPSGFFIYEIDNEYERHVVNFIRKCCSCRVWDLTGIPCKHGVAAIYKNLERPEDYVHACYRKDVYVAAYKEMITPLPGQDEWIETNQPAPVAPIMYKPPDRPPMKMKKDANEPNNPYKVSRSTRPIKCGFCHKERRNSMRCKAVITGETPWQDRDLRGKKNLGLVPPRVPGRSHLFSYGRGGLRAKTFGAMFSTGDSMHGKDKDKGKIYVMRGLRSANLLNASVVVAAVVAAAANNDDEDVADVELN
ncbi:hypothetical protein SO802_018602 [Lithocarpus litseifolius]|uniref:SWIM-type domain-containing protein n=1 Tax=Lithocarpus litseifolius TaxID=425828 RepID=A0AAW2CP59_9ROSI